MANDGTRLSRSGTRDAVELRVPASARRALITISSAPATGASTLPAYDLQSRWKPRDPRLHLSPLHPPPPSSTPRLRYHSRPSAVMASAFKDYTAVHHLQTSTNLAEFDGTRIAVDADDYLHTLLTNPQTREPLLPALGGLPFALEKHVNGDLTGFAEAGITVVWVFNGLDCASRSQGVVGREGRRAAEGLSHAWDIYDSGRGDEAVLAFGKNCTPTTFVTVPT